MYWEGEFDLVLRILDWVVYDDCVCVDCYVLGAEGVEEKGVN